MREKERYWVQSFGCRANQADGAALESAMQERGLTRAESASQTDWVVLNTCTVTAAADADARSAIRRAHQRNPEARIVVTGCYAQRAPQELVKIDGVCAIVGNTRKHELADLVAADRLPKLATEEVFHRTQMLTAPAATPLFGNGDRTRPILKVQDGCNQRCSYCVIPFVRGASRSLPLGAILAQVQALIAAGYREVVISGINLGHWGRDLDEGLKLADLVRSILDQTPIERVRLSSVEPMDWDESLINLLAEAGSGSRPRLARHAHIPLQSGSDSVLRRMHRRYRPWHYAETVQRIRAASPQAAIGADVMVGFPGESEAEFAASYEFIAGQPFTYLHIFTFSSREGTEAQRQLEAGEWALTPPPVAAERQRALRALIADKQKAFLQGLVGSRLSAITLSEGGMALSDNFVKVKLPAGFAANQMVEACVTAAGDGYVEATAHG